MKKKILSLMFVLVLILMLVGCGGNNAEDANGNNNNNEDDTNAPEVTDAPAVTDAPDEDVDEVRYCDDGLEGETIKYYAQAGLTGPLSTILGTGFIGALNDSIAEINDAGGICGATIELVLNDTQYDTDQEVAIYQQVRADDPPPMAIMTYGSGATVALAPFVNEDKIVNITAGLNAKAFYVPRNGYTVGVAPIYSDQFAGFMTFLSENWADVKPEGAGDDIVVGVIGWDHPFGEGATTPEALAVAADLGITVLPLEKHALSQDADYITPIQTLAMQGANVIYYQGLGGFTAGVIATLHGMELWDSMVVGGCNWAFNTDVLVTLEGLGIPEAMIGFYGVFPWNWWTDTDLPGVQKALAAFEAGGYSESDKAVSYLTSYAGVYAWADIVEHAIDMVGFENLSGEVFMAAFQELGTVDALGIFTFDVRGENRAPSVAQIGQVQLVDGEIQFVVIEDFFELPDTRPAE